MSQHFPELVANDAVRPARGHAFADAGMLHYRADLLEKYRVALPATWSDLADAALFIQEGERTPGNRDFWGFVFQGQAYEGLTCNAFEWIEGAGGGRIVAAAGAPRVTQFIEENARITFQLGKSAFMRNWPYAWALLNAEDSAVRGTVGAAPLPKGSQFGRHAATLGGWQLAVSRHAANKDAAIDSCCI